MEAIRSISKFIRTSIKPSLKAKHTPSVNEVIAITTFWIVNGTAIIKGVVIIKGTRVHNDHIKVILSNMSGTCNRIGNKRTNSDKLILNVNLIGIEQTNQVIHINGIFKR